MMCGRCGNVIAPTNPAIRPLTAGGIVIGSTLQPRRKGTIRRETRRQGDREKGDKGTGRREDVILSLSKDGVSLTGTFRIIIPW